MATPRTTAQTPVGLEKALSSLMPPMTLIHLIVVVGGTMIGLAVDQGWIGTQVAGLLSGLLAVIAAGDTYNRAVRAKNITAIHAAAVTVAKDNTAQKAAKP